ncbi:MAG: hypothetical protein HY808_05490 [Nitrospirae bacterium]|nr:hypothetical protein [Nitrospirota bacterium]
MLQQPFITLVDQILAAKKQHTPQSLSESSRTDLIEGKTRTLTPPPSKNRSTKWSMRSTASRLKRLRLWREKNE